MTAMIISLFGVMVTLIATYTKSDAFTYFGTIISAGGIVFQYFVSKPYVLPFSLADLTKVGERKYELRIPHSKHRKSNPNPHVFKLCDDRSLREVICDFQIDPKTHDIIFGISGNVEETLTRGVIKIG
jgi:hypothetical protein